MSRVIKLLEKRLLFRELMEVSGPAIYALINDKHKKIYILSTTDLVKSLAAQASQLGRRTHTMKDLKRDKKYLEFRLLETVEAANPKSLADRLFISRFHWTEYYQNQGYLLYNANRTPKYKARVSYTEKYTARVDIVSSGRKIFPIQEFPTEAEAQAFIDTTPIIDLLKLAKSNKST